MRVGTKELDRGNLRTLSHQVCPCVLDKLSLLLSPFRKKYLGAAQVGFGLKLSVCTCIYKLCLKFRKGGERLRVKLPWYQWKFLE